jgi:hypothetical protein
LIVNNLINCKGVFTMSNVKLNLLKKFLVLFIKNMDLTTEEDKTLFAALKIVSDKKPLIND